jgi:hypothetical protein
VKWREASGLAISACDGFGGEPSGNADRRGLVVRIVYSNSKSEQ